MSVVRRLLVLAIAVAVAVGAGAAALSVVDGPGDPEADPDDPASIEDLATTADERERTIALAERVLGYGPGVPIATGAVGVGVGTLVGAAAAYRRQRWLIRRGRDDV